MTPTQELTAARAVIENPDDWCIGLRTARKERGEGYRHCALGAIEMAQAGIKRLYEGAAMPFLSGTYPLDLHAASVRLLAEVVPAGFIEQSFLRFDAALAPATVVAVFNNESDHPTVMAWFDRAIARSKMFDSMLIVPFAPVASNPREHELA